MNRFNKRVYEMLNRIVVFSATYPFLFVKDSLPAQLLEKILAALQAWSGHATSQVSGEGAVRRTSMTRAQARGELRSQLEKISRTARAQGLPEFWMPRNRGDNSFVDVGKVFLKNAQPNKQLFIDGHMPADFLEKLDAAVQNMEAAIADQTATLTTRTATTRAIEETRMEAVSALQRLDPIMANLLHDDAPTFAAWQTCRHVERAAVSRSTGEDPPKGEDAPVPTPAAATG